jgi:DNA processing protein
MSEVACIAALQLIDGVGNSTINKIISAPTYDLAEGYNSFYSCYLALKAINKNVSNLESGKLEAIYQESIEVLKNQEQLGIKTISRYDKNYPVGLSLLPSPPPLIHFKGNLNALNQKNVAVVGSRKMSLGTDNSLSELVSECVKNGFNIVSGLALGVDTTAHKATLKNHGITIAVMAHGLETVTPSRNKSLANEIIANNGCLFSEYLIGTPPSAGNYIIRNSLQVAISSAVIIGEAHKKSGTMETAKQAFKQGKLLGCLPVTNDNISNYTAFDFLVHDLKATTLNSGESKNEFFEKIESHKIEKTTKTNEQLNLF